MSGIDFEADSSETTEVSASDALNRVTALVSLMAHCAARVELLGIELEKAKKEFTRIEREDLPELMKELNLSMVKLENGMIVDVVDDFACSITVENKPAAHGWLTENKFDGLIKTVLAISFPKEDRDKVIEIQEKISEFCEAPIEVSETIHAATLKSFIKGEREKGEDGAKIPADLFGLFVFSKAKITVPKAPKSKK